MADLFEMTGKDDRRRESRIPTRSRVWADPGGLAPVVDCMIVDLSNSGARIASVDGATIPDAFTIAVNRQNELGAAIVMWRVGNEVGVKFEARAD